MKSLIVNYECQKLIISEDEWSESLMLQHIFLNECFGVFIVNRNEPCLPVKAWKICKIKKIENCHVKHSNKK